LTYLFLSDNEFLNEAPIPDWIHNLTTLWELSLQNMTCRDSIPEWLDVLDNLLLLDVSDNRLNGTIPASLGYNTNLCFLLMNHNELMGGIPSTFNQLDKLGMWSLLLIRAFELCIITVNYKHSTVISFSLL
jgi:hypothetical protein